MPRPVIGLIPSLISGLAQRSDDVAGSSGPIRRRLTRKLGLVLAALLLFVGFILAATLGIQRSFLIEGTTSSLTVEFVGSDTGWLFRDAVVCEPLAQPDPRGQDNPDDLCPATIFDQSVKVDLQLLWQEGEAARITMDEDGFVQVEVLSSLDPLLPAGSLVVLTRDQWRSNGALAFQGLVEIGEDIGSGSQHYLLSGSWEARQTSYATRLRSVTDVVKAGDLARGTQVSVFLNGESASMVGHVTPSGDGEAREDGGTGAFEFVVISEPGRTEIRLEHFGLDEPVVIRPDWIDTAVTSPLFLAAIVVLTLVALLTQIYGDLSSIRRSETTANTKAEEAVPTDESASS